MSTLKRDAKHAHKEATNLTDDASMKARKEALKVTGKESQAATENMQKKVQSTGDILTKDAKIPIPIIGRHPKAILGILAGVSIHKNAKRKRIMEQNKALQEEYQELSKTAGTSFGAYYERARNEVKRERLEHKVEKIKIHQERAARIGRLIGTVTMGAQQMARMSIQRDTYNSVRADTKGTLRKDLPLMVAADGLDDDMSYGM